MLDEFAVCRMNTVM